MKVTKKNNSLIIELELEKERSPSTSGKTLKVATSHGYQAFNIDDEVVSVSVNATVPAPKA